MQEIFSSSTPVICRYWLATSKNLLDGWLLMIF